VGWEVAEGDDRAKTPDELEAEAKRAEQDAADADKAVERSRHDAEHDNDDQQMADTFNAFLGGQGRVDGHPLGNDDSGTGEMGPVFGAAMAHGRAKEARDRANWARRAIAYGLTLAGTAMLVAGVAGVGNAAPAAGPAPSAGTTTAAPSGSAPANKPPVVGPIVANLIPTNTFYNVTATDPEGDKLTYVWTKSNPCGSFTFQDGTAVWAHPHPPCPNEEFHPGTITVVVTDGHGNAVTRTYEGGSQTGTGLVPGSAAPTTTSRAAQTASSAPTSTPAPTTGGGGPNVPLVGGGLLVGGLGA